MYSPLKIAIDISMFLNNRIILRDRSSIFKQKTPPACVPTDFVRTVVVFLSSAILNYTFLSKSE